MGLKNGYINKSPYRQQYETRVAQILTNRLRRKVVESDINITDDQLKEYYTNNQ